jgi:CRISPR system Cascade subunit CasB
MTMADPQPPQPTRAQRFVEYIDVQLSRGGGARRALETGLRPWSHEPPGPMHAYVAPWLPSGLHPAQERAYYTVAALMTTTTRAGSGSGTSVGKALGLASKKVSATSAELAMRRLVRHTPAGPYAHLRGGIRVITAAGVHLDWARLLGELEAWYFRGPRICTQWQQDYYRAAAPRSLQPSDSE